MASARLLIRAAPAYLGTPYSTMDCQAFVERCLSDIGINLNLAGSNAWYREVKAHGWVGTPDECKRKYGSIPPGAFLFILKDDGKEPAKYHGDGIGNASHIGIYTAMTGAEMCELSGKPDAELYNYGNGAINSSNSRGYVCTSKFAGKAISGGWNRIGLWDRIDYGGEKVEPYKAVVINGSLNLRAKPDTSSGRLASMPEGSAVTVEEEQGEWDKVTYNGMTGYCMSKYLSKTALDGSVSVSRDELEKIYNQIGQWLRG